MTWFFIENQGVSAPSAVRDFQFGATLPEGWSLTRTDAALARSPATGRWVSYAANVARPQIHPVTLTNDGILVEPAATQMVLNSRFPNYAASNATSVRDDTIQTPFGLGALKLTPTTLLASHGYNFFFEANRATAIPDNTTVAINVVLKPVGAYTHGRFAILGRDGVYRTVSFILSGSGSVFAVSPSILSAEISPDTDGFYSIRMVLNFGIGTSGTAANLAFALDDDTRSFAADGTSYFLVAYLGAEVGSVVTSPIITGGIPLTRPGDILETRIAWAQTGGIAVGIDYTPISRDDFSVVRASSASATDYFDLISRADGDLLRVVALGGSSAQIFGTGAAPGITRTSVVSVAANHFRFATDGVQVGVDPEGAMPQGITTFTIGGGASGSIAGSMIVRRLKVWNTELFQPAVEMFSDDLAVVGEIPNVPILDIQPSRVVTPNETSVTLVLGLDRPPANSSVSYRTVDASAVAGVDYVGVSGEIIFEFGRSSAQIVIAMAKRALSEDRIFKLELFSPVNCALANDACVITLQRVIPAGTVATTRFDFNTPTLTSDWTITRTTAANSRNAAGIWGPIAANLPRLHYHAPGVSGYLLEPAASDQRLYDSVDPGLTAVASTRAVVTTEQTATGSRQVRWRKDATTAEHKLTGVFTTAVGDMPTGEFTLWFLARPVNWPRWKLRVKGIDNVWRETRINLSAAGSVTTSETGTTAYAAQDPHFPDWYQFGMYRTQTTAAGVSGEFELIPVDAAGASSTAGDITHGIDICHVQLEPVAGMTSPIIVSAATAKTARAADSFRAAGSWFKFATYTVALSFIRLRNQPITQRLLMIKDQSLAIAPDDIGLVTTPGSLRARIKVQGTQLAEIISTDLTVAGLADTAMLVIGPTSIGLYHNGIKMGEDALTATPVIPGFLKIGSSEPSGIDPMSLLLEKVYLWNYPVVQADAELFSGNLGFVPIGTPTKPIVSVPTGLSVAEGSAINVPVSRTGTAACQVNIRTRQNTALVTADYTGIGPVAVSFAAGETQKLVAIQTVADTVDDNLEDFTVQLELIVGNATCELGNASCTVTILQPPRIDIATTMSVTEGQAATVSIVKTGPGICSVTYRTVGVTAVNTTDYTGIGATTLSFTDTETTKTVQVQTITDAIADSGETFRVVLENPTGCSIGNDTCTITILDPGADPDPVGQLYTTPVTFANTNADGTKNDFGVGQVPYYVTSLADTNVQGTLRHACSAGNRLIMFEVGGVIKIPNDTGLNMTNLTNVTIAGETAPSPGIIIQGGTVFMSRSNGLNVRHITFERGYDTRQETFVATNPPTTSYKSNGDAIIVQGNGVTKKLWIDHCATLWSNDEGIQIWRDVYDGFNPATIVVEDVSITNTMVCEPLFKPDKELNNATGQNYKGHWENGVLESEHNYGVIFGDGVKRIDMQYNFIGDSFWRAPIIGGGNSIVISNMVTVNCVMGAHHGGAVWAGPTLITCVGYLKINGRDNRGTKVPGIKLHGSGNPLGTNYHAGTRVWYSNLYSDRGSTAYPLPETKIWGRTDTQTLTSVEAGLIVPTTSPRPIDIPTAPVVALSQTALYDRAMLNMGPRPKDRGADGKHVQHHIQRQFDKLKAKDGAWVNHQDKNGIGGFSVFTQTNRSLRNGTGKFRDGTAIPAFPTDATNKTAVRAWLRRFLDDVQYD